MATKISPAEVQSALSGVEYPATKQELIGQAKDNNADDSVVNALQGLPNREFNSPADVTGELS